MTFNEGSCCGGAVKGKTCHDVITENNPDFTKTIAIINGGIECGIQNSDSVPRKEFFRRNTALEEFVVY